MTKPFAAFRALEWFLLGMNIPKTTTAFVLVHDMYIAISRYFILYNDYIILYIIIIIIYNIYTKI